MMTSKMMRWSCSNRAYHQLTLPVGAEKEGRISIESFWLFWFPIHTNPSYGHSNGNIPKGNLAKNVRLYL